MTEPMNDATEELLDRLVLGFQHGHMLRTFVMLGLADSLDGESVTLADLATRTGVHTQSLARLLTAARALGLVQPGETEGTYGLGPLGRRLTARPENHHRPLVELYGPWLTRPWDHLEEAIRTGRAVFPTVHGTDFWSYVREHPQEAAAFNEGMAAGTAARAKSLTEAIDLPPGTVVVDVGGGTGGLLAAILRETPGTLGILADTAEVVAGALSILESEGVTDRVRIGASDFFRELPTGGDVYVLSRILHDWADEPAEAILRTTRTAMDQGARLVVMEGVLPESHDGDANHLLELAREDLEMLVLVGGRERTLSEYRAMLDRAGFEFTRVHPVPGRDVIIARAF